MEFSKTMLVAALALAAAACGGGGDNSSPEPVSSFSVGGTVSGLDGSVAISVNGGTPQSINTNGAFSLASDYADGTTLSLSLSDQPFTQRCSLSSSSLTINGADISDLMVSCSNVGSLSGSVAHYHTGAPVAGASLTLYASVDGVPQVVATGTADQDGQFTINATGISSDFQLVASAGGYVLDQQPLANSEQSQQMSAQLQLLPIDSLTSGQATQPLAVTIDGLDVVSLPANSLADSDGQLWSGPVSVEVGVIDPSADPGLMPGDYRAIAEDGDTPRYIESFGALSVVLSDGAGNPLQLAAGAQATIRIPLAARLDGTAMSAEIPLYWFDEGRGLWIEEGRATLENDDNGYYYQGQVSHFTVWNADDYINTVTITGCVRNDGQPVAGAQVMGEGQNYIGRSTTISDSQGNFSLPVRVSSSVLINAIQGSQSNTRVVTSPESGTLAIPQCLELQPAAATVRLSWGAEPRDLDSHLLGNVDGSGFELYFGNESILVGDQLFNLDVDNTSGYGPEMITMPGLPNGGSFHYVVHRYAGFGTIASSPARVELNLQGRTRVFTPPAGDADEYWHVFSIAVDNNGQATLTEQQQWLSDDGYAQLKVDMGAPVRRTLARQPAYKQR
ncbi:MAG: hypothetical protein KA754_00895 [Corallincola sp.]|nr:hypothetical protein [Corallincola sp.]